MKQIAVNRWLSVIILVVSGLGFMWWNLELDYQCDDFWYMHYFPGREDMLEYSEPGACFTYCAQRPIDSWDDVFASIHNHNRYWNNSRLANAMMFASVMFPKWVGDVVHGLMIMLMFWAMARLVSGRRWKNHPLRLGAIVLYIWLVCPWFDFKASSDYFINYVWSTALVLLFLVMLKNLKGYKGVLHVVLCSILGFVAATMHEGISVPFACGLVAWIVLAAIYPRAAREAGKPNVAQIVAIASFCAGVVAITLLSPSFRDRFNGHDGSIVGMSWYTFMINYGIRLCYVYVGIALALILLWRRGRGRLYNGLLRNMVWIVAALASFALVLYIYMRFARASWTLVIVSAVLTMRILVSAGWLRGHQRVSLSAAVLCLVLITGFYVDLCAAQRYWTGVLRRVDSEIAADPDARIYYVDIDRSQDDPWWRNFIFIKLPASEIMPDAMRLTRYNHGEGSGYSVLPTEWRGVPLDSLPLMPGTAGLRGVYPYYYSKEVDHDKPWKYGSGMYTQMRFPDDVSPFVKYTPASLLRLLPGRHYNELKEIQWYHTMKIAVSDAMRESGFVGNNVDSITVYQMVISHDYMQGMRPVSIDRGFTY